VARLKLKRCLGCFTGVIVIALVIASAPIHAVRWSGFFPTEEYQLTFLDEKGRPVPDVSLQIESPAGNKCYFYPVNEFLPDQALVSNSQGLIVFHHVQEMVEYGGADYCNLLGYCPFPEKSPQYYCVVLHNGQEVYRFRYNTLWLEAVGKPKAALIAREWSFPNWSRLRYVPKDDDWDGYYSELFNGNRNQKLDREQQIGVRLLNRGLELPGGTREIDFPIIERTIFISTQ
jgi:hypothetical protein